MVQRVRRVQLVQQVRLMLKASFVAVVVTLCSVTLNAQTAPPASPMEAVTL